MDQLRLVALDKRRLQDFEHLLSGKEFNGCYCAAWAGDPAYEERCKSRPLENLEQTRSRVLARRHVGFLAVRDSDGAVVAWTGAGPKSSFPALQSGLAARTSPAADGVWSIGCLAVARDCRGLGYSRRIVEGVIEEARRAQARVLESYPVEPSGDDTAFRGTKTLYESLGFAAAVQEQEGGYTYLRMEKALDK